MKNLKFWAVFVFCIEVFIFIFFFEKRIIDDHCLSRNLVTSFGVIPLTYKALGMRCQKTSYIASDEDIVYTELKNNIGRLSQ